MVVCTPRPWRGGRGAVTAMAVAAVILFTTSTTPALTATASSRRRPATTVTSGSSSGGGGGGGGPTDTRLPYLFAGPNVYASVAASDAFARAVTCTVANPSQDNDPTQAQDSVCRSMEESLLTLAEARAAAQRVHGSSSRRRASSSTTTNNNQHSSRGGSSSSTPSVTDVTDTGAEEPCNILVVDDLPDSFNNFLRKFRYTPVVFTLRDMSRVDWGHVPWQLFDWTAAQAEAAATAAAATTGGAPRQDAANGGGVMQRMVRCLCNPIHGSILHESSPAAVRAVAMLFQEEEQEQQQQEKKAEKGAAQQQARGGLHHAHRQQRGGAARAATEAAALPATKYCMWETSALLEHFFGNSSSKGGSSNTTIISNAGLAELLRFQCRVTPTCHGSIGADALRHTSTRVSSLDWWPLDKALGESGLWISSGDTRTALHHDLYTQFLVQLAGEKVVSLVPDVPPHCFKYAWLEDGPLHSVAAGFESTAAAAFRRRLEASGCLTDSAVRGGVRGTAASSHSGEDGGGWTTESFSAFRARTVREQQLEQHRTRPVTPAGAHVPAAATGGEGGDGDGSEPVVPKPARFPIAQCRLRPGQVLWIPPRMPHDIYSATHSLSLSIRFEPGLADLAATAAPG